jgi:hypothetical protein
MKFGPKLVIALSAAVVVLGGVARPVRADEANNGTYWYVPSCPDPSNYTAYCYQVAGGCGYDGTGAQCYASTSGPLPYVLVCWNTGSC